MKILGWQTWSIGAARIDVVATLLLAAIVGLAGTASAGPSCSWDGTASPASLEGGSDAQGSSAPIRFWLSSWIDSDSTSEAELEDPRADGLPAKGLRIDDPARASHLCRSVCPVRTTQPPSSDLTRAPPHA